MRKLPFAVRPKHGLKIVGRVGPFIPRRSVTDFEIRDFAARPIDQMVGQALRWKTCTHTRRERGLTLVGRQRRGALKNVDEFILFAVPMKQCRLPAGMQGRKIYTEVLEAEGQADAHLQIRGNT